MSSILQEAINELVYMVRFSSTTKGKKYFVYGPTAQRTEDKNELWSIIKNDNEVYTRLMSDTGLVESELERRVLKLLTSVPSVEDDTLAEDAVTGDADGQLKTTGSCDQMGTIGENNKKSADESKSAKKFSKEKDVKICKVRVENFGRKEKVEDCKTYLKKFNEVIGVDKIDVKNKLQGFYDVTFENEESAREFVKIKKIKYKERTLKRRLLYSCAYCSKSYFSFLNLYSHVIKVHDVDHFECSDCGKVFSKKKFLQDHKLQEHEDSEFICVTCKKKFKSEFGLTGHLEFGEFCSHLCQWCLKTFKRKNDLEKHQKICQSEGQPGGSCLICYKSFELQFDLEWHRKKMTNIDGSYKYVCEICEQIFCDLSAKLDHVHGKHTVGEGVKKIVKLFPCETCGLNLQSKKDLLNHLETHSDRKSRSKRTTEKYKCDLCHSEFTVKKSLDRHMLGTYDEHKIPKYRCEECDTVYCTGKQFEKHQKQKHSGLMCPLCDQWFTTKRALECHSKRQEAFTCSVCGKQLCSKKTFTAHTNIHEGDASS